ncbi:MAG: hypothetical protein N3I35_17615 [Clostridia bacterium]|nr:hypothetical protein [Clostridia bacterium]
METKFVLEEVFKSKENEERRKKLEDIVINVIKIMELQERCSL